VLLNLLSNAYQAVESTRRGGRIELRAVRAIDQRGRWVAVEVVDNGPGIPAAYIDRIFEPFFTTREDGTGYGLYFSSEILKAQGGRLSVRNNEGGGATFPIWLPADEADSAPPSCGLDPSC